MKIIFYCQYVLGMGHLFRSLKIASALSSHEVTLVVGGQPVTADVPAHVRLVRLPALYMDEKFTTLISGVPGQSVAEIQRQRKIMLFDLFSEIRPDLLMVELYPFGRTIFRFELEPLLEQIASGTFGAVKKVCSLRDVLVEKRDPAAYETRVLKNLNANFDLLLIHSDGRFLPLDETFSRVADIPIPLFYTGFVTRKPDPGQVAAIRDARANGPLIVASAGGGRTGAALLKSVAAAGRMIAADRPIRLHIFTGPFMDPESFATISRFSGKGISVRRFTGRMIEYLAAADLSVSMAGYNTCMDLLVTQVPALVYPYARQQEQPLRAHKIRPLLPMEILGDADLEPDRLCCHILKMLERPRPDRPLPMDLDGTEHTARYLEHWIKNSNDYQ